MDVYPRVGDFIRLHQLIPAGAEVVLGISGGADSLCLLDCLHHLGFDLLVAHLDHQLRPESGDDALFVSQIADGYGLPSVIRKADLAHPSKVGSKEERAREARYQFLSEVAQQRGASFVATGHTADDQVETILMHLIRGAGPTGLRGMLPSTELPKLTGRAAPGQSLVRPLLCLSREETWRHCRSIGLEPRIDSSNIDRSFLRNRIRLELLPLLEEYNPNIRDALLHTGELMRAEVDLIDRLTSEARGGVVEQMGEQARRIHIDEFILLDPAIQQALLQRLMRELSPSSREITYESVVRALQFVLDPCRTGMASLAGGISGSRFGSDVLFMAEGSEIVFPAFPQVKDAGDLALAHPGVLELGSGWKIAAHEKPVNASDEAWWWEDQGGALAAVDSELVLSPLRIRARREGDRFHPLGADGSQKLSDFFINERVPRILRDRWPLVVSGDEIVWVGGLRISQAFRITPETKRAIVMRIFREGEQEDV